MRRILSLVVLLVVGIIVYNQFYGTAEDKERGKVVAKETKEVFQSIVDLLKAEKDHYDEGKYDDAFEKIGGIFKKVGEKVETLGDEFPNRFKELEEKKSAIEAKLKDKNEHINNPDKTPGTVTDEELEDELKNLLQELEKLTDDMNKQ